MWRAVEQYRIATLAITGDAMARPLIEALQEHAYDVSSLVAISSTAAVFSPVVKDQLFELLPNLFISEAVGSSESGFNGMRLVEKGNTANATGLINVARGPDTIVIGDDDRPVEPGEVGRMARGGNVPLGYYKDPEKSAATFITVDGKRYSVPGDFARLELDGTHDAPRARLAVHQLRGREDLPRGGGGRPEGPPGGVRRPRRRRRRRAVGPAGGRRRRAAPGRDPHPRRARRALPHQGGRLQGAPAAPPRRRMPRHPSGKPDYRRARAVAEEAPA